MRGVCRGRIEAKILRYLDEAEVAEIDLRLTRSAVYLARNDASWRSLSRGERMKYAATHATEAAMAEANDMLRAYDLDFKLRQAGRKMLGADFDRLEASGRMRFENTPGDIDPALADDLTISAVVTPEGPFVVFRERVTPETMPAVLLHEAGAHVGLPAMLGKKGYERVRAQAFRLAAKGDPDAVAARQKIPADTPDAHFADELLAYTVETGSTAGPISKLLADVKAWAIRAFPMLARVLGDTETLRSLAVMAIRHAARREGGYALGERLFAKGGQAAASIDETAAKEAFGKRLMHAVPDFDAARLDAAWDMHKRWKAAQAAPSDLFATVPGEAGPQREAASELRRIDRMVERFRGCVL